MSEIIKWIIALVIVFLVVGYITSPTERENINDFFSNLGSTAKVEIESATEEATTQEDSSIETCLNELDRKFEIIKEKSLIKTNIDIKEYKKLDNNQDALDYLESWEFTTNDLVNENLVSGNFIVGGGMGDWFDVEQDNIIIGLIKQKTYFEGQTFSQLYPFLCIDGDWKTEKRCPKGVMSGINLIKHIPTVRVFDPADYPSLYYEVYSEKNDLKNYSLVLKDNSGNVLESDFGDDPSGGKVEVSLEDKDLGSKFETIFTFTTSCGTHKE